MLHPEAKKKFKSEAESVPELETVEQRQVSIEKDLALTVRAKRQECENTVVAGQIENEDQRFELTRKKVLFYAELTLTVAGLTALIALLIINPALIPLMVSGASGLSGLLLLFQRRQLN